MSEPKKLFDPKASLVEQSEFYWHEHNAAKTRDMALLTFGAYMALCRAVAGLEKQDEA